MSDTSNSYCGRVLGRTDLSERSVRQLASPNFQNPDFKKQSINVGFTFHEVKLNISVQYSVIPSSVR